LHGPCAPGAIRVVDEGMVGRCAKKTPLNTIHLSSKFVVLFEIQRFYESRTSLDSGGGAEDKEDEKDSRDAMLVVIMS